MNNSDVATTFVYFKDKKTGKPRPVLVISDSVDRLVFYNITSKFADKSQMIQAKYYEIKNWKKAGLFLPSWIDIGSRASVSKEKIRIKKIGSLTPQDIRGLADFIENYYED